MTEEQLPDYVYKTVARTIEGRIKDGTYRERLPAMTELAADLGVAVMTVRRAIEVLADPEREGGPVVRVLQGSGTYVIWRGEHG
jgi:DNA-binding GntR family transcriptional regulator